MSFKLLPYLRFLLKSTNAHGVHSPFVFDYVTQCLYGQKKYSKHKSIDVLLKSIHYFNATSIHLDNNKDIRSKIQEAFDSVNFNNHLNDILFFGQLNKSIFYNLLKDGKLHNDSLILVNSIHEDSEKERNWEALTRLPEITVSIDMFHCGAIFIRKEQVKQHFTIRI